jgi:uncharacterized protein DUF4157
VTASSAPAAQSTAQRRQRGQEQQGRQADSRRSNAGKAEVTSAEALFQPSQTDRSPQAWLARLRGQKSPAEEQARAAAAGPNESATPTSNNSSAPVKRMHASNAQTTTSASNNSPAPVKRPASGQELKTGDLSTQHTQVTAIGKPDTREPATGQGRQSVEPPGNNQADKDSAPREAMPLSQQTRRFLRPLLGIDPAAVPIYRDTLAGQATGAFRAEALVLENQIELGEEHVEESPRTLGLLAHELTHVARQQKPRFIPPVARGAMVSGGHSVAEPPATERTAPTVEEALAGFVEGRVRQLARREQEGMQTPLGSEAARVEGGEAQTGTRHADDPWGGLPAPWEPLPASWLDTPTPQRREAGSGSVETGSPLAMPLMRPGGDMVSNGQAGWMQTGPGVQRASIERSVPEEAEETPAGHDAPKAPEPDLDALARQVYAILKRRLGVEYRRGS